MWRNAPVQRNIAYEGGFAMNAAEVAAMGRPKGLPFRLNKIGHLALYVSDLQRSAKFYTEVLGFQISDVYAEDGGQLPGGAVFVRLNADHHGIALFKATKDNRHGAGLHHIAFEVSSLDEVLRVRDHLRKHDVRIHFEGRRRAGVQLAVEFQDPDGHNLEIYWGIDQVGSDGYVRPPEQWKGASSLEAAIADPVVGQDTSVQDKSLLGG
jgi:catechol 2,3-dioxygenase